MNETRKIVIGGKLTTWLGQTLSNFAFCPFVFEGHGIISTEGFWQGLKWPKDTTERYECFGLWGLAAKRTGDRAEKRSSFRFRDQMYEVGSSEHLELMKQAIKAKIVQNDRLLAEFVGSGDAEFTHPVREKRNAVLTNEVFLRMLMELREELRRRSSEPQGEEGLSEE